MPMPRNVTPILLSDRKLPSWIAGFLEFTEGVQSPELFRKCAAIGVVAGAMERKVWLRSQGEDLYPNVYIFLVGPPGSGKTRALMTGWRLWNTLEGYHVADISLTKAALVDCLSAATRSFPGVAELPDFNSLLIAVPELGAFLPTYDSDFMNTLTHLYDGHLYTERRRTAKTEFPPIERPNINMVACTTPGFLTSAIPISAWNEGFLSRVMIAYSGDTSIKPFDLDDTQKRADPRLRECLVHDLKKISERIGRLRWTSRAMDLVEDYNNRDFDIWTTDPDGKHPIFPKPTHPRLMNYNVRRPVHFLKLCMICAVDRGAENIDLPDVTSAVDIMSELENAMPDVFTAMSSGGDSQVITDTLYWILTENVRLRDAGVPMPLVYEYISTKAPAAHTFRIFELMIKSGMIHVLESGNSHVVKTKPRP